MDVSQKIAQLSTNHSRALISTTEFSLDWLKGGGPVLDLEVLFDLNRIINFKN